MDSFELLVETRTARRDEFDRVLELSGEMTQHDSEALLSTGDIDWQQEAVSGGNAEVAVAYDSATDNIVASGIGLITDRPSHDEPIGYIKWMSTASEFRGYGVGEQILNHLLAWFRSKNVSEVALFADAKAAEFYAQHGFVRDAKTSLWIKSV